MVWIVVCGLFSLCGTLFYCSPVSKSWNTLQDGHCVNRNALNYVISTFSIFNDLMLLVIPIFFLRALQIAQKQRIILISIFACGFM